MRKFLATAAVAAAGLSLAFYATRSTTDAASGALPVTVLAQTATTMILGWTPPAGAAGYEFTVDGKRVSNTWTANPTWACPAPVTNMACVKFGVADGHSYGVVEVVEGVSGSVTLPLPATTTAPTTTAPSAGQAAYDVTITPNWLSHQDSASSNLQNLWIYPTSPSTPYLSPDSQQHVQRYMLLDPRYTDANGVKGNDDWWFIIQRDWLSSYLADGRHGAWAASANFHNVAGDAGPGGGVGWSCGSGVSSLGLQWLPNEPSPVVNVEPMSPSNEHPLPVPNRDEWHTYVLHWIAGRTDGSTVHPGALTVWDNGTKVLDLQGINTVQRATCSDGNTYTQRWMQLWEGDYTSGLQAPSTYRLALTRIGHTLAEAVADQPTVAATNQADEYYSGTGTNYGAPSVQPAGRADQPIVPTVDTTTTTTTAATTTTPPPTTTTVPTTTTTPPPTYSYTFRQDFEAGGAAPGGLLCQNKTNTSVEVFGTFTNIASDGQGNHAGKFDLPANSTIKQRCQINEGGRVAPPMGTDEYFTLMLNVPASEANNYPGTTAGWGPQLWEPEYQGHNSGQPSWTFDLQKDGVSFRYCTGNGPACQYGGAPNAVQAVPHGQLAAGWHEFIVHVHLSDTTSGVFEVWHRLKGAPDWTRTVNLTGLATVQTPFSGGFQDTIMAYRSPATTPFTVTLDDFTLSNSFGAAEAALP